MYFYEKMQDMECLAGDTLPIFNVEVEVGSGDSIEGCSMYLILARAETPQIAVINKECTATENGFSVQLDSNDTIELIEGTYDMHFNLISTGGSSYRKLLGQLYVHTAAKGGT